MTVPLPADFHESLQTRLEQLIPADSSIPVEAIQIEGNASAEILRVAEEQHCNLIVMGTHGRAGFSRVLLGSVAEDVTRHSRVPVLTLKTPTLLDTEGAGDETSVLGVSSGEKSSKGVLVF